MRTYKSLIERFEEKYEIDEETGCWLWTAYKCLDGYGKFSTGNRKLVTAHRWSYEYFVGPIPKDMELDHVESRCHPDRFKRRSCVNPDHLESVTHLENMRRGANTRIKNHNARKTHCPHGHEYTEENTVTVVNKKGQKSRQCRECKKIALKKSNLKHREKRLQEKRDYKKYGPKGTGNVGPIGDFNKAKTHCPRGHPYAGDNLIITRQGSRSCRECKNMLTRNRRKRLREEKNGITRK